MSESESEEFAKKLTALLKERDRARVAIFDLHMAVSKAEEMRDRGVESAKAAGTKILELQGELSGLKTELGAASLMLKGMVERAEASEKRAISLQGVVERVREEISKAEVPEITEEQLEAGRKILEGSRIDPITGDLFGRGVSPTFDELDKDENYDDWGLDDLEKFDRYRGDADEEHGVLTRRSVSLSRFRESSRIVKILGAVSCLLGVAIVMTLSPLLGVVAASALVFALTLTFLFLLEWGVTFLFPLELEWGWGKKREGRFDDELKPSIPLVKPFLRKKEEEVPPSPPDDTPTRADVEAIFGDMFRHEDPDEDGGD